MKASERHHPLEVRAAVVAAVLAGAGVVDTARRYGLQKQTVSRWVKEQRNPPLERPSSIDAAELEARIYGLVTEHTVTLRAQLQAAARPEWLAKQTAGELAALVVAENQSLIRLLGGFKPTSLSAGPRDDAAREDGNTIVVAELAPGRPTDPA